MSIAPAIELSRLTKTFRVRRQHAAGMAARIAGFFAPQTDSVLAVDSISFRIEPGERVAFIGPNGAGKSTTLKMLAGIMRPDSGEARVLGLSPWHERRRLSFSVGTVFGQRSQLWYNLPARDTFDLFASVYDLPRAEHRRRLDALISAFSLEQLLDKPVRHLSLGERMRCEVAASLLHRPRILFLDEPTIGLDVSAKATMRELLQRVAEEDGATLLLTSHDTGDIERVCDRVIVIHHGRVLLDGPIDILRQNHLRTRRVTMVTAAERVEIALPGVRVLADAPHRCTLEVDTERTSLGALVDAALRQTSLRDLSIEEPPLDEMIRDLYATAEGSRRHEEQITS
jgi:ABC-2 type transport system ATP-binding protein